MRRPTYSIELGCIYDYRSDRTILSRNNRRKSRLNRNISKLVLLLSLILCRSFIHAWPVGQMLFGFEQQTTSPNTNTLAARLECRITNHASTQEKRAGQIGRIKLKSEEWSLIEILWVVKYVVYLFCAITRATTIIIGMPGRETLIQ